MAEKDYYEVIKKEVEKLLTAKVPVYLEITANGKFSQYLKSKIPNELVFYFLKGKGQSPDITGFVELEPYSTDFIIIEAKEEIKLNDIYQTKKYRDLFDARYTFLVTLQPIPEEVKRLCKNAHILNPPSHYQFFVLVQLDKNTNQLIDWFPENPFDKSHDKVYWNK